MANVTSQQVMKILELTDSFNLHRESVTIPLMTREHGGVETLPDRRLRIAVPSDQPFDTWLVELTQILAKMDLSPFRH